MKWPYTLGVDHGDEDITVLNFATAGGRKGSVSMSVITWPIGDALNQSLNVACSADPGTSEGATELFREEFGRRYPQPPAWMHPKFWSVLAEVVRGYPGFMYTVVPTVLLHHRIEWTYGSTVRVRVHLERGPLFVAAELEQAPEALAALGRIMEVRGVSSEY
jgi:hypothetical protein